MNSATEAPEIIPIPDRHAIASGINLVMTALPYVYVVLLISFAFHIHSVLGHWPVPHEDGIPGDPMVALHQGLYVVSSYFYLPLAPLIWIWSSVLIWREVELWILVKRFLIFVGGYITWIIVMNLDTVGFLHWFWHTIMS